MEIEGLQSWENYLNLALELSNQTRPPHSTAVNKALRAIAQVTCDHADTAADR